MGITVPWTDKMFELLADREWHKLDPIVVEMGKLIPSEKAWRYRESERVKQRGETRHPNGDIPPEAKPPSDDYIIATGRRQIAYKAVETHTRNKRVKMYVDAEGTKFIKLNTCPECDQPMPPDWGTKNKKGGAHGTKKGHTGPDVPAGSDHS